MFKKPHRRVLKVYIHCSASDNPDHDDVSVIKAWHVNGNGWSDTGYHYFITKKGERQNGRPLEKTPAAQGGYNRGSLAICVSGLKDFTKDSFEELQKLCGEIHDAYDNVVTYWGHCDVSSKPCPVFDYKAVLGLNSSRHMTGSQPVFSEDFIPDGDIEATFRSAPKTPGSPVLRMGHKGMMVEALQQKLVAFGYPVGTLDGHFGQRTRAAVLAFQVDNDLITDGIAGEMTFEALGDAEARAVSAPRQTAGLLDLAKGGSRIADASVKNVVAGAATAGGGVLGVIVKFSGLFTAFKAQLDPIAEPFGGWSTLGLAALGAVVAFMAWNALKAGQARLDDHQTGKTP